MRQNKSTFETLVTASLKGNINALRKITELCLFMGLDRQKVFELKCQVDTALEENPQSILPLYLNTLVLCKTTDYSSEITDTLEKIIAQKEGNEGVRALASVTLVWLLLTDGTVLDVDYHQPSMIPQGPNAWVEPQFYKISEEGLQKVLNLLPAALEQKEPLAFSLMTGILYKYKTIDPSTHFKAANLTYNNKLSSAGKAKQFLKQGIEINTFTTLLSIVFFFRTPARLMGALNDLDQSGNLYYSGISSLMKTDHLPLAPVYLDKIAGFIHQRTRQDVTGRSNLILCQLFLLFKNNKETAQQYFESHPNKKQALKSLLHAVTNLLEDPNANLKEIQALLDFAQNNGAANEQPVDVDYLQLKVHFYQGNDQEAFDYYETQLPDYYPLTANEYFRLGSVLYAKLNTIPENDKEAYLNKTLELFYKAYVADEKSEKKSLQETSKSFITNIFSMHEKYQKIDNADDTFKDFLKKRRDRLSKSNNPLQIAALKGYRYACQKRPTLKPESGIFTPVTHLFEIECIDQLVENLKEGKSLPAIMKDKGITQKLKECPHLMDFICDELLPEDNKVSHQESMLKRQGK